MPESRVKDSWQDQQCPTGYGSLSFQASEYFLTSVSSYGIHLAGLRHLYWHSEKIQLLVFQLVSNHAQQREEAALGP
jgi:hypothetical protein